MAELIVAFDLSSGREALALAARLPGLRWAKIGPVLYTREGPAIVREFVARGLRVFLDLKWHDIPSVVAEAVAAAGEQGVAMATVHTLGGPAMLAAAAGAAGNIALVGVTILTSHDTPEVERVFLSLMRVDREGRIRPRLSRRNHLRILHALWGQEPLDLLRRLHVPTLVVATRREGAGEQDQAFIAAKQLAEQEVRAIGTPVAFEWMEGIHDVPLQHPRAVAEAIRRTAGSVGGATHD